MPHYSAIVQEHFHQPRNVGPLEGATHQGTAGAPGDGPYAVIWLRIEGGRIAEAAYRTHGCPAAMASCSMVAELATGKTVDQALGLRPEELMEALGGLPEGKEHCPVLAVEALRNAIGGGER